MSKSKKGKNEIKLITNPQSGDPEDPTHRLERVTRALMDLGFKVDVVVEKPKKHAYRMAKKAAKQGYRLVVVMGGDGTIEAVARGLVGKQTCLGILMGGTENNISRSLGIPEDLEAACRLIAEQYRAGNQRKIDVGRIKVKKGKKRYFFEFAAMGLIADLFPSAQDLYKGRWSKLPGAVNEFLHYRAPKFKLKLDKESKLKLTAPLVTISNTPMFGVKYLISPNASLVDGLLDVNFYTNMSKTGILAYFQAVSEAKAVDEPAIQRYRARKIKIKAKPKQAVVADGIMLGKGKVKIKVKPGALRVIAGELWGQPQAPLPEEEARLPEPVAPEVGSPPAREVASPPAREAATPPAEAIVSAADVRSNSSEGQAPEG